MYLEYWGLHRNPFDSVPDPGMYFRAHSTVESTVAELLFAVEEANECLAVVVGEVGLGKTTSLRVVLNELPADRYRIAFVTNPDITFVQLMREIIGQLEGEPCVIRGKEALLEAFNRILFETADSGRKVLVFIDEGNAMKGPSLEGLRLLTNMQEDDRNLLTIVIAGQPKLGRMLEDPRRANLFQRVGVYARLEPIASAEIVRDYIEHRLERAGASARIFDDSAVEALFRHSGGVPRLVNRLCKLSLKAGETNGLGVIGASVVEDIAARFEPAYRRSRQSTAPVPSVESKPESPESPERSFRPRRLRRSPRLSHPTPHRSKPRLPRTTDGRRNRSRRLVPSRVSRSPRPPGRPRRRRRYSSPWRWWRCSAIFRIPTNAFAWRVNWRHGRSGIIRRSTPKRRPIPSKPGTSFEPRSF
jgi:type II secretory pathway predicted ATPase ExeA